MAVGRSCTIRLLASLRRRSGTVCVRTAVPRIVAVCCQAAQLLVLLGVPVTQLCSVSLSKQQVTKGAPGRELVI
jgi:hypothetical protein